MVHVYQPPKNFLKVLWINHSVHHYKHGEYVFGVSSPLWDYIYGTMKEKKKHFMENICTAERRLTRNGYFEFDAQPPMMMP